MMFLEAVLVNVFVFVICMYVDRYLLDSYCKQHKYLDRAFKMWLGITAITVFWVLVKTVVAYVFGPEILHTYG